LRTSLPAQIRAQVAAYLPPHLLRSEAITVAHIDARYAQPRDWG
jgi:hypothetical protein